MSSRSQIRWWLWAAVALTVVKLWLTRGQAIFAIGTAGHDDQLFVKLADYILHGQWLGPYDQLTLAKGPFYSIWMAAVFVLGIPLGLAQQLVYAGACALVVRALAPRLQAGWGRFAAYMLLLWNPMSFEASSLGRVLRQHISTPLALMVFAGLIALYLRRDRPFLRLAPWAALLGGAFGALRLTREDNVWIGPSLVLLAGAVVFGAVRASARARRALAGSGVLTIACALLPVLVVCWLNARYYGWWGTVEFRASEFKDAYGALLRVKVGPEIPFVPVTRQAREAIYPVSPSFALLKAELDGPIGEGWAGASSYVTHLPAADRQIGGGWFMWALRDSVANAGFCHNAAQALAYYHRLAMEVNEACERGRLPARPPRSGFLPPWRKGQTGAWLRTAAQFAEFVVAFRGFSAYPPASIGEHDDLELFKDITRDRLAPSPALDAPPPTQQALEDWKLGVLQGIGKVLRQVLFWLIAAAQAVAAIRLVQLAAQRRLTFPFVLAVAAWGAAAAIILMDALVQVTSFPTLSVVYLDSAYPLVLVFVMAILLDVAEEWTVPILRRVRRRASVADDDGSGPSAASATPTA